MVQLCLYLQYISSVVFLNPQQHVEEKQLYRSVSMEEQGENICFNTPAKAYFMVTTSLIINDSQYSSLYFAL